MGGRGKNQISHRNQKGWRKKEEEEEVGKRRGRKKQEATSQRRRRACYFFPNLRKRTTCFLFRSPENIQLTERVTDAKRFLGPTAARGDARKGVARAAKRRLCFLLVDFQMGVRKFECLSTSSTLPPSKLAPLHTPRGVLDCGFHFTLQIAEQREEERGQERGWKNRKKETIVKKRQKDGKEKKMLDLSLSRPSCLQNSSNTPPCPRA